MRLVETPLPGVLLVEPRVFRDPRGFFLESWHREKFAQAGLGVDFAQDNHSKSLKGTIRGIHYQVVEPQGKLVRCLGGAAWDVAVDLRRTSPTFGRWYGVVLSVENLLQLWIPPGFGHGFLALEDETHLLYRCTAPWRPDFDRALRWDDPVLGIEWPLHGSTPLLSPKDALAPHLDQAELFE